MSTTSRIRLLILSPLLLAAGCANMRMEPGASPAIDGDAYTTLQAMVAAYENKQLADFMRYVHEDYAADRMVLESAVRQDFSQFARIDINLTMSAQAPSGDGDRVQLALRFTRQLTPVATGRPDNDTGLTQVVMVRTESGWKLWSMQRPGIFGVSDSTTAF